MMLKKQVLNTGLIITLFNLNLSALIDFDNLPWKTGCESGDIRCLESSFYKNDLS